MQACFFAMELKIIKKNTYFLHLQSLYLAFFKILKNILYKLLYKIYIKKIIYKLAIVREKKLEL